MIKFLVFFSVFYLFADISNAQDNWWKDKVYKTEAKKQKYANCKRTFIAIAEAINHSNANIIQGYCQDEVYISLLEEDKGYFKLEQVKYIFDSFFTGYPVNSFKYKSSSRSDLYAFATGIYKYNSNGFVNSYHISISLRYFSEQWLIDQILVN